MIDQSLLTYVLTFELYYSYSVSDSDIPLLGSLNDRFNLCFKFNWSFVYLRQSKRVSLSMYEPKANQTAQLTSFHRRL